MVEELIAHCSPTTVVGNRANCGLGLINRKYETQAGRTADPKTEDQLKSDTRARLPCDERSPFFRSFRAVLASSMLPK